MVRAHAQVERIDYVMTEGRTTPKDTGVVYIPRLSLHYSHSPFRPVVFDRGASCRLQPDMATGGGDQVWTWKKRKTVAASRAARGGNEITTVSVVSCPPSVSSEF